MAPSGPPVHPRRRDWLLPAVLAATLPWICGGCVSRTLVITSEPTDALVLLDGRPLGRTPVEVPFTWYGTREVFLYREGPMPEELAADSTLRPEGWRQSGTVVLRPPTHQKPGLDLVSDLLYPGQLEDRQAFHFELERIGAGAAPEDPERTGNLLLERAGALRERALEPVPPGSSSP
jgi:hypothetical protein